jgi:hypothetical protein
MKPGLKKLNQEQFDEAVQEMMDGLGLEADEAIESAVEEFEIQGYTLEGIIRAVGGAEALASLPSAVAAKDLKEETSREGRDTESLKKKVLDFQTALEDVKEGQDIAQLLLGENTFASHLTYTDTYTLSLSLSCLL